jgi:hypothetical protein
MKTLALAAVACFGLVLADSPRFAPEEKSSVEKTIRSELKFASTEFKMSMDGIDIPEDHLSDVVLEFQEITKLVLTDRYVKSKDGRPLELDRTYDELTQTKRDSQRMPGMKEAKVDEKALESALESKTVRFSWDAKEEKYGKAFAGGEGDEELLEDLAEDVDFRGMLPKDGAKAGDKWKIEAKEFNQLLSTGGDLHFSDGSEKKKSDDNFGKQISDNLTGQAELVFEEVREKDGLRLAVITFKSDFKSHAQMDDGEMKADVTLQPHGELLWDLERNRIHALEVESDMKIAMTGDQTTNRGGTEHTMHIEIALEGTLSLEVATKTP